MSLIGPADAQATPYGDPNLYIHKNSGGSLGFSMQTLTPDKRLFHYEPDSYHSEVYDQSYFNIPSPAIPCSLYDLQSSSNPYQLMASTVTPGIADDPYNSCMIAARYPESSLSSNISQQSSQSLSDNQSSEQEIEFEEDKIRLKLHELEQALLDDNDEYLVDLYEEMCAGADWGDPIKNLLLPNSPKESSMDSSSNCIGVTGQARPPKQLLFECAAAISDGSVREAQTMIMELRQMVSIQGDPPQRLAAYLVESLAARIAYSGQGLYKALKCKEPPSNIQLSAMQILFEVCPCFKFGFMAANYAIVEALKGEERVHIIDFDINQGSQYIQLIQSLSTQTNKPARVRLTGVDDPESVQRAVGGLRIIGQRLEKLAEDCGVPFEFHAVAAKAGEVLPSMLGCRPGEALIVNFAFQLHHMPDESVSIVNQRDRLLRMVKGLRPKLVTVVEQDVNTNTAPFFQRFMEVYNYYSAIFDSLDATLPRDSADRMNVERQCLAREIVNVVACEGTERIERYETAGKWKARMTMAGFGSCSFNTNVGTAIRALLKSYCNMYMFKEEAGALHFGWEDKSLVVASAWR